MDKVMAAKEFYNVMADNNQDFICSICIITRDQAEKLERCLKCLQDLPVDVVVLDTGSVDQSKKVAEKLGARVFEFKWIDDFSAARNEASMHAICDQIMVMDTDECLFSVGDTSIEDAEKKIETIFCDQNKEYKEKVAKKFRELKEIILAHPEEVGEIQALSDYQLGGRKYQDREWSKRIYDRRYFHYEGIVHEQLVPIRNRSNKENLMNETKDTVGLYRVPIMIFHDGYDMDEESYEKKGKRNGTLILKALEREPNDPYLWFQLAKAEDAMKEYDRAVEHYAKALECEPDLRLNYVKNLLVSYGYDLMNLNRIEEGMDIILVYLEKEPAYERSADFVFLLGLFFMNMTFFDKAVDTFMQATGLPDDRTVGTNSFLAYYNAGVIREVQGRKNEALDLYSRCGDYDRAKEAIRRVLDQ